VIGLITNAAFRSGKNLPSMDVEGQGRAPGDRERTVWIAIGVHEQLQVSLREARKRLGRIVRRMYSFS
jgi:hypothetical protein